MYTIAAARPSDLPQLPAIELAAAALLAGHAPASVLAETTSQADLEDARRRGHLWVALADDVPVGFAHIRALEPGIAHLEEIDVHPEHGRRGLGGRLVITVCAWAAANGYSCVTLTTFRDVPWNMPFYARLGFEEILPAELGAALLSVIEDETRRGLDPDRRVAMRRRCVFEGPSARCLSRRDPLARYSRTPWRATGFIPQMRREAPPSEHPTWEYAGEPDGHPQR
jgi:GNAT superfamily N-acetyltransferase